MVFEPYRSKVVEPIPMPSRSERETALKEVGYNLFRLPSELVTIDLLTDSGTGAMSANQWSALVGGDEAYAGASSWSRFNEVVTELTGFDRVFPVHQGRAAERILFSAMLTERKKVVSNHHFDTTRANIGLLGGEAIDLPSPASADIASDHPFKGDIDLVALERLLSGSGGDEIALVLITVTDNAGGGQPVSMANLIAARRLCDSYRVPLYLDACRFAENAYLITQREPEFLGADVRTVAREMFRLADGATMSLKKDGLGNVGGFLVLNDGALADRCRDLLIATEGFPTYGGLAGRDLDALAVGLTEVTDRRYLAARHADASYLADGLESVGVPTVRPTGCHAVYADAGAFLPGIPPAAFPGHALAVELYREGGIRACEMGTLVFGASIVAGGQDSTAEHELLRLALPRRVYQRGHFDHVIDTFRVIAERRDEIGGYHITSGGGALRHFTATLEPAPAALPAA